jgi:hypothetical protein
MQIVRAGHDTFASHLSGDMYRWKREDAGMFDTLRLVANLDLPDEAQIVETSLEVIIIGAPPSYTTNPSVYV